MPLPQLLCGVLEKSINTVLSLDPDSCTRLRPLQQKMIAVTLAEVPFPLVFAVSDVVTLMSHNHEVDCRISTSIPDLMTLQNNGQITAMIQSGALQLEGDIQCAQHFAAVFQQLNIDWEEQLSSVLGDVTAHNAMQFITSLKTRASHNVSALAQASKDALINEKHVVAPTQAIAQFCDDVATIRSDVARLEARLNSFTKETL